MNTFSSFAIGDIGGLQTPCSNMVTSSITVIEKRLSCQRKKNDMNVKLLLQKHTFFSVTVSNNLVDFFSQLRSLDYFS